MARRIPFNDDSFKAMVEVWNEELGMTMQLGPYDRSEREVKRFVDDVNFGKVEGFDEARLVRL